MKLSVITINWNDKVGLEKTMQSVVSQTYSDYEYIVIDGASTDGSLDIIHQYRDQIDKWTSEPDSGIYNAMNKGIQQAEGEYYYFLNSGDFLASEYVFEEIFREERNESFICGNIFWEKNGQLTKDEEYKNRDWVFSLYDIYSGFLSHQAFFIKKTMFDKYGLYDERLKIMSDWKLFFIAIGIHREGVKYIDFDISVYNTDGISSRIGGEVILKEKRLVAKEELSPKIYEEIDRLYDLQKKGFIIDFIYSKKWILFVFKAFMKICVTLRLSKID